MRLPGRPDGHSGKLAHACSASALTISEPETKSTLAAPMATQPTRPSRGLVAWVVRTGTRAQTVVTVAPTSIATPAIRWAATVGAPLPANTGTAPRAICIPLIPAVTTAGRTVVAHSARAR